MRFAAIGLLAGVLCAGCALQTGDPGDETTAVPATGPAVQFGGGVAGSLHSNSNTSPDPGPGAPNYNPQPAPWGSPLVQGQSGSSANGDTTTTSSGAGQNGQPLPGATDDVEPVPGQQPLKAPPVAIEHVEGAGLGH